MRLMVISTKIFSDHYGEARKMMLPEPPAGKGAGFYKVARYLKVYVQKDNGNTVRLTMPVRVADDLEGIIDPPIKETIRNQGLYLSVIQKKVLKSCFVPQTVFEVKDSVREVRI